MASSTIPSLEEMLQAGVHFGHQASHWHPKMEPFIFGERRGVHIINLEETQRRLQDALEYVKGVASRGGVVLFVGTKRQAQDIVKKYAEACGMPYIHNRWLGGTCTNFDQMKRVIKKFRTLKEQQATGELRKYTKKEQVIIGRTIQELEQKVGGIETLDRLPDVIFIIDLRREKTAYEESKKTGIKIMAMCDTNTDPSAVYYPIPANDDAVKSIEMITRLISEAIQEGKSSVPQAVSAPASEKPMMTEEKEPVASEEVPVKVVPEEKTAAKPKRTYTKAKAV